MDTNASMRQLVLDRLRMQLGELDGRTVGILGLAFKANTDDVRESPAVEIARTLLAEGAQVRAFDPVAMGSAARLLPEIELCSDAYTVADGAEAVLVLTEWPEFQQLDLVRIRESMRQPLLVDGRNLFEPDAMAELGFSYHANWPRRPQPSPRSVNSLRRVGQPVGEPVLRHRRPSWSRKSEHPS